MDFEQARWLMMEGSALSPARALSLESRLAKFPNDLDSRTMLLGYYFTRHGQEERARRREHALWVIENEPASWIAGQQQVSLNPALDRHAYFEARELWMEHLSFEDIHTAVLANAAQFLALFDPDVAQDCMRRAQAREPRNPEWSIRLGEIYSMKAGQGSSEAALDALWEFERAYVQLPDEIARLHLLPELAKAALRCGETEKARGYASQLLTLAQLHQDDLSSETALRDAQAMLEELG